MYQLRDHQTFSPVCQEEVKAGSKTEHQNMGTAAFLSMFSRMSVDSTNQQPRPMKRDSGIFSPKYTYQFHQENNFKDLSSDTEGSGTTRPCNLSSSSWLLLTVPASHAHLHGVLSRSRSPASCAQLQELCTAFKKWTDRQTHLPSRCSIL